MMAYGGDEFVHPSGALPVSLTRSGLPRIIPPHHRAMIRRRDEKSDLLVKLYLSIFSLSKVITLAKKVDKSTFASIVTPVTDMDSVLELVGSIKECFNRLVNRYVPWIKRIPLEQGLTFEPTWKTLPTHSLTKRVWIERMKLKPEKVSRFRSSFTSFPHELGAFQFLMNFVHAKGEQFYQGCLWPPRVRYAFDVNNKKFTPEDLDWFERRIGPLLPSCDDLGIPPVPGRLGCSLEGAGKRRIFAIGNYINLWLLRPVHCWFASILKTIPMDGTYDQLRPLRRLVPSDNCFSYDLKSATDRWPLVYLFEIVALLFDRSFASSVVNSTLATNLFIVPFVRRYAFRSLLVNRWDIMALGLCLPFRTIYWCGGQRSRLDQGSGSIGMQC